MTILFAIVTGILFGIGVFQVLRRDLIRAAMGFSTLFLAINLFFIAVGSFDGNTPPYSDALEKAGSVPSDPLVQALVLTAVVIGFGSFSLLLGLINMISYRYGTVDSDEVSELRG